MSVSRKLNPHTCVNRCAPLRCAAGRLLVRTTHAETLVMGLGATASAFYFAISINIIGLAQIGAGFRCLPDHFDEFIKIPDGVMRIQTRTSFSACSIQLKGDFAELCAVLPGRCAKQAADMEESVHRDCDVIRHLVAEDAASAWCVFRLQGLGSFFPQEGDHA